MIVRTHRLRFVVMAAAVAAVLAGCSIASARSATVAAPAVVPRTGEQTARPNFIFILVDDLPIDNFRIDNPSLKTPNLDRLAREGTYGQGLRLLMAESEGVGKIVSFKTVARRRRAKIRSAARAPTTIAGALVLREKDCDRRR